MTTHTKCCHFDSELTLHDSSQSPLTIRAIALNLTKQDDTLSECRLTFQLSPQLYQRIDAEALFHLKPELRTPLSAGDFLPEPDIEIEATVQPNLLPLLIEDASTPEQAAAYLQNLSQEQPDHPLLSTESWLGLHVKQPRESGETSYRTFWAYVSPSVLTQDAISLRKISEGMVNFFKEWAEVNLPSITGDTVSEALEKVTKGFEEWADTSLSATTQETIFKILEEMVDTFQEWTDAGLSTMNQDTTSSKQILEEMLNFFVQDDWPFTKIQGEPILRTAFQGENGTWTCYAKVREEQQQFVFYSVVPTLAPEDKRQTVAEFLTRANYGMVIGNFELDFADGEIRYKTSIDVKGDFLSSELIKQMVYANVEMMDTYLSGIMSVIYSNVSPVDAIAQIEGQPD